MSTDIERADNTQQQTPASSRKISRREFTIGALTTLGLTAATLKGLTFPKHVEAQQGPLAEIATFNALVEDGQRAKARGIPVKSAAVISKGSGCEVMWVLSSGKVNDYTSTAILSRAVSGSNNMLGELRPLPAIPLTQAVRFEQLGYKSAIVYGALSNEPAIAYTDDGQIINVAKVSDAGITMSGTIISLVRFNDQYFLPLTTKGEVGILQTNLDSVGRLRPIFRKTDVDIFQHSLLFSKKINPSNPDVGTVYSIQYNKTGDTSQNGLFAREIDLRTGKTLSGPKNLDNRFSSDQTLVDTYLDTTTSKETLLTVGRPYFFQIIDPTSQQPMIEVPTTVLLPDVLGNPNSTPPQINHAKFCSNGDIIVTGSFKDKEDEKLKIFVVKVAAGKNPNIDPSFVEFIYKESLINGTINLHVSKISGKEVALISTSIGELVVSIEGKTGVWTNKELTTKPAPQPQRSGFIGIGFNTGTMNQTR